jgi:AraC family transcriptional regulator, regulatory protein of adaptative response / methylated-DNA-[protein]-cysteine methyltransferase
VSDLDQRWRQVQERSEAADRFVYAVTTTGIFCRPACPSRRPRRANVRFYDSADQARADGFRPCKRCRPDEPGVGAKGLERVVRACRAMVDAGGPLTAGQLERLTGCSSRQLARDFAAAVGASPRAFGDAVRTGAARRLLREGSPVTDAVYGAGFGSARGFYETAGPTLGMAPKAYAGGATGQTLRWTTCRTSVGVVLAAVGDLGLAAVYIGDDAGPLLDEARREFPGADLVGDDDGLADVAQALRHLADGRPAGVDLPLDLRGTAFQATVWQALRRIPAGQTRTYAQVAAEIGRPSSVRAVARACATNRLALVVPCHRVVRSDGHLAGYRWGIAVKRSLLDHEAGTARTAG